MKMSSTRRTSTRATLLAMLVVGGLTVAACGNSSDDASTETADTSAPAESAPADSTATTESETTEPTDSAPGETTSTTEEAPATSEAFESITGVPGVTDTEIAFSLLGTGPAANPLGTCTLECYGDGIEAYFAYRNSEGGVHGRELKLTNIVDDELANNQVKALEIINANDTFGTFSIPFIASGFADLAAAGVPLYTTLIAAQETAGQESSFANGGVTCISCTSKYGTYIAEQLGATVTAAVGYGVSQPSKDCVAASVASIEEYGSDLGLTVGFSTDELPYALPNGIAPEVTAMKNAGVNVIFTCLDGNSVKTLKQEMQRQGLDATVILPDGYGLKSFFDDSGDLFEGDLMTVPFRPFEADTAGSGVEEFNTWINEVAPDTADLGYAMFGWMSADLAYRGIADAPAAFDRESVVAATNALEDYTGGGVYPPIDWNRQHIAPTPDDKVTNGSDPVCIAIVRVQNGTFELFGGQADKPWACWDPSEAGYTEPTLTNFD